MRNKIIFGLFLIAIVFLCLGYFIGTLQVAKTIETTGTEVSSSTNYASGLDDWIEHTPETDQPYGVGVVASSSIQKTPPTKNPPVTSLDTYIKIGQKISLNSVSITPVKVAYDSRCPKDVRCIQAGSIDVGVLLESGTLSQNVIITSGKPFSFAGKFVTLTNVTPVPLSTKK